MSERVIIIGAGGHGKVIADIITACGDEIVGFLDDNPDKHTCGDFRVIGRISDSRNYPDCSFVIAIGNNAVRKQLDERLTGVAWYTAVHPSAVVSPSAEIGDGTVVMPRAVINAEAIIGRHCIINTGSVIEHENRIADYVHISPCAALAGNVSVGAGTHVGIGACIRNNVSICADCVIGAGAVVVKKITESGTYIGVPAKKR